MPLCLYTGEFLLDLAYLTTSKCFIRSNHAILLILCLWDLLSKNIGMVSIPHTSKSSRDLNSRAFLPLVIFILFLFFFKEVILVDTLISTYVTHLRVWPKSSYLLHYDWDLKKFCLFSAWLKRGGLDSSRSIELALFRHEQRNTNQRMVLQRKYILKWGWHDGSLT
jgi:hypothetical protein